MKEISNYIQINELISTSAKIKTEQFEVLKDFGFEILINLDDEISINENEKAISLGFTYIQIPVCEKEPNLSQLKKFLNIMQALASNKIWVYCQNNYKVSAFMYVYHKYVLKTPFEQINLSLLEKWCPNENWQELLKVSYEKLLKAY